VGHDACASEYSKIEEKANARQMEEMIQNTPITLPFLKVHAKRNVRKAQLARVILILRSEIV